MTSRYHIKLNFIIFITIGFSSLFFSCSPKLEQVRIFLEDDIPLQIETIESISEFFVITDKIADADFILSLEEDFYSASNFAIDETKDVLIGETVFTPILPLWDERTSVPEESLDLNDYKTQLPVLPSIFEISPVLVPIQEVKLPWKAVAVDSLYPPDANYPFIQYRYVSFSANSLSDEFKEKEQQLYTALYNQFFEAVKDKLEYTSEAIFPVFHLGAVGDVMPGRGTDWLLQSPDHGITHVFNDTLPLLQTQDFLVANLETAVTYVKDNLERSYTFKVSPKVLPPLKEAGIDYVSLTNNHCYDYGEQGFRDTLYFLEQYEMPTSGAGYNLNEAQKPYDVVVDDKNTKLRILSIGAYPAESTNFDGGITAAAKSDKPGILWNTAENREALKQAFADDEFFNILIVHGGYEYANEPSEQVKAMYRQFIDLGANAVLAHHPHVLQGMEEYNGGLIAYSLGNFVFPGMQKTEFGEETAILSLGLYNNGIKYVDFYPVKINIWTIARDYDSIGQRFSSLIFDLISQK